MSGVRSVAVVGHDTALWVMAMGLKRVLSRIGVSVTAVELPSALGPGDVVSALPSLANLHGLLGLPEEALWARCGAVPVLGQQFIGWSAADFIHGYDVSRPAINDVDFVQFWSLARRQGMRVAFEEFSLAAVAAKHGCAGGGKPGKAGDAPQPGYHVGAQAYAALLRQGCVAAGVEIRSAGSVEVEREGERVRAVRLDDGSAVEADLFVDASGSARVLIGDEGFEVWDGFPATHLLTGTLPPITPPPAFARIVAVPNGWVGLFPLQDRTVVTGHIAGEANEALVAAGIGPVHDLVARPFAAGMLRQSWVGNVVAVGEASVALERLDGVEIQSLQAALSNLAALWPVRRDTMPEARGYDRAMALHAANIRDFQQAHILLSTRAEPYWLEARRAGPSPDLDARLALFAARGIIAHRDDETFLPQSWTAMLIGHGIVPSESDPAVERTPQEEQIGKVQQLLRVIAEDVRAMPSVGDFLASRTRR
ncbi:MAG: tryptophan 7-halogenase [Sphingomonas sp.]